MAVAPRRESLLPRRARAPPSAGVFHPAGFHRHLGLVVDARSTCFLRRVCPPPVARKRVSEGSAARRSPRTATVGVTRSPRVVARTLCADARGVRWESLHPRGKSRLSDLRCFDVSRPMSFPRRSGASDALDPRPSRARLLRSREGDRCVFGLVPEARLRRSEREEPRVSLPQEHPVHPAFPSRSVRRPPR